MIAYECHDESKCFVQSLDYMEYVSVNVMKVQQELSLRQVREYFKDNGVHYVKLNRTWTCYRCSYRFDLVIVFMVYVLDHECYAGFPRINFVLFIF